METIGLVVMKRFSLMSLNGMQAVVSSDLRNTVESTLNRIRESALMRVDEAMSASSQLEEYVDRVVVMPASDDYANQVSRFILSSEPGTRFLITDLRDVLPRAIHSTFMREARKKGILVVALKQKALLKVDVNIALELQNEISQSSGTSRSDTSPTSDEEYQLLKDLMLAGRNVPEIVTETGWSRSTVFRMRRKYEERLKDDVPGFAPQPYSIVGTETNSDK